MRISGFLRWGSLLLSGMLMVDSCSKRNSETKLVCIFLSSMAADAKCDKITDKQVMNFFNLVEFPANTHISDYHVHSVVIPPKCYFKVWQDHREQWSQLTHVCKMFTNIFFCLALILRIITQWSERQALCSMLQWSFVLTITNSSAAIERSDRLGLKLYLGFFSSHPHKSYVS